MSACSCSSLIVICLIVMMMVSAFPSESKEKDRNRLSDSSYNCSLEVDTHHSTTDVTVDELKSISSKIWESDETSITGEDIKYNVNGSKLFSYVNEEKLVGTFALLDELFDNYIHKIGSAEINETGEFQEEEMFLDGLLETKPMQTLHQFLISKGLAAADLKSFKTQLRQYWFLPYSRSNGIIDSSGFEHVFMGEIKKDKVVGFHNWLFAYRQEQIGLFEYEGLIRTCPNNVLAFKFDWMDYGKPISSSFIGTSPELEMAILTLCFVTRADENCPVLLDGKKQSITTLKMNDVSESTIATAYVNC